MEIFINFLETLSFLILIICCGIIVGRKVNFSIKKLSKINEILLSPFFIFGSLILIEMELSLIWITVISYCFMGFVSIIGWKFFERIGYKESGNLIGLCGALSNCGNFGIPIVKVVFGSAILPIYSLFIIANILYAASIGYYIAGRGQRPMRESIMFVLKLPMIHAALMALIIQLLLPEFRTEVKDAVMIIWEEYVTAFTWFGLFVIGLVFSHTKLSDFNWRFQLPVFTSRFLFYPALTLLFVWLDQTYFYLFTPTLHKLFYVYSILPCARKIIMIAAMTDIDPGKAAAAVLSTTIFATFMIPLVSYLFFQ